MEYEFISGELFSKISDVSIYEKKYLDKYPNIKENSKQIIYANSRIGKRELKIIKESRIFFVKTDYLIFFEKYILPFIDHKFIMISHNSAHISGKNKGILNNEFLIKWYGQNMIPHPKTYGIPLGLMNKQWEGSDYSICKKNRNNEKINLLYFNFSINTNKNRVVIRDKLLKNRFEQNHKKDWKGYIEDLSTHFFCVSPEGMGVDCHRIWECLYVGTVPIVLKNDMMYEYFNDLPILWVDSFDDVTEEFLLKERYRFEKLNWNCDKARLGYWIKLFSDNIDI